MRMEAPRSATPDLNVLMFAVSCLPVENEEHIEIGLWTIC
jgi:hypothetical protein